MSRIVSALVGIYAGLVIDQNFEVPKVPMPTALMEQAKKMWSNMYPTDDKGNGKNK